jgi:diadenosine tetraphosphate (Ap4A) HIT family hydrolase
MCEQCNIQNFLKGQEWKIFQDDEIFVNYSKHPQVDGHLVIQPRRHVERITQLSYAEWSRISNTLYRYATAVEKALNDRAKENDKVDKIYLWCFCASPHDHLHIHIKPKMKSVQKQGKDFFNYTDPARVSDEEGIRNVMNDIKKSL